MQMDESALFLNPPMKLVGHNNWSVPNDVSLLKLIG